MLYKNASELSGLPSKERVVIVGSGAVGLHLANELLKRGSSVTVIEAGGVHLGSFAKSSHASVGRPHEGIINGRSRSLGGTSNLWGGQLVEYQPVDFRGRAWLKNSSWPISHEEIAPYYRKTYDALGIPSDLQEDEQVWRSISRTPPNLTADLEVFLTRWLKVPSFAILFGAQIKSNPLLHVLTDHAVVGFEYGGARVTGVIVKDEQGVASVIKADTVVMAAGTIENARLLLHGAASGANCPWHDNANIGYWFQDHLGGRIGKVHAKSPRGFFDVFCTIAVRMFKFAPKIRMTEKALTREPVLNIQGMVDFESSISENLVYLKQFLKAAIFSRQIGSLPDAIKNITGCIRYLVPLMWRFIHDHRIFVPSDSKISLLIQAEQTPLRESRISIDARECDQFGLPKVILDWKTGEHELHSVREFALRAQRALAEAGLGELEINPDLLAGDARFLDTLRDTTHQAGGAVMGYSKADGVVDSNLKVFGTENLYVGGASVFRTVSNANVTFTALALATRLAEHLTSLPAKENVRSAA